MSVPRIVVVGAAILCAATILIAGAVVLLSEGPRTIVVGDVVVCLASVVLFAAVHVYVDGVSDQLARAAGERRNEPHA